MNATEAQIEERLPVWEALSEFFLDTELQPDDYDRIARKLAATKYKNDEIEEILLSEVCPVCRWNLHSPAGEWMGFDAVWLKEKIAPRLGKTHKLKFLFKLRHSWMYARHWKKIRARILEIRAK